VSSQHEHELPGDAAAGQCWKVIGVAGAGSCAALTEVVHCRNCPVFAAAGEQLFEREPPAEYIAEQTDLLARKVEDEAAGTEALLLFRLGREWIALDVQVSVEVAEARTIHRVPHRSGDLFLGIVNIRGELQLCASLHALLGLEGVSQAAGGSLPSAASSASWDRGQTRLLVCQDHGRRWVFPVDEVAGVVHLSSSQLGNVPSTVDKSGTRLVNAVFRWAEKRVGRLDTARLFDSLEERIG
jgi:chemotaxis-related protein WspD